MSFDYDGQFNQYMDNVLNGESPYCDEVLTPAYQQGFIQARARQAASEAIARRAHQNWQAFQRREAEALAVRRMQDEEYLRSVRGASLALFGGQAPPPMALPAPPIPAALPPTDGGAAPPGAWNDVQALRDRLNALQAANPGGRVGGGRDGGGRVGGGRVGGGRVGGGRDGGGVNPGAAVFVPGAGAAGAGAAGAGAAGAGAAGAP